MEWYSAFIHHWDKVLVILIAVAAIWFLVRKFRKGECNCSSCGKKCPARKFGNEKK